MRTLLIVVLVLMVCNLGGLGLLMYRSGQGGALPNEQVDLPQLGPRPDGSEDASGPGHQDTDVSVSGGLERWLTPQRRKEIRDVLGRYYPELQRELEQTDRGQPGWRRRHLVRNWRLVNALIEANRVDPELAKQLVEADRLSGDLERLANQYHDSAREDKRAIATRMREVLEKQFDVRQWTRRRRLERLDKQISDLRKDLASRQEHRDALISRELRSRLGFHKDRLPQW